MYHVPASPQFASTVSPRASGDAALALAVVLPAAAAAAAPSSGEHGGEIVGEPSSAREKAHSILPGGGASVAPCVGVRSEATVLPPLVFENLYVEP